MGKEVTTGEMLASAKRELGMRLNVYPRRVQEGKMSQERADHEIACMKGIVVILQTRAEAEKMEGDQPRLL